MYWKTLKPLAEALRKLYPYCRMSLITNGSLLDIEKNEWIDKIGLDISISHDGPGQHVRGPDPLNDLIARDAILDLYSRLAPQGRISFGSMVNRWNTSRAAIQDFFVKLTGDKNVRIGEGGRSSTHMIKAVNPHQFNLTMRRLPSVAKLSASYVRAR